jgi:hypothetical protein
VDVKGHLCDVKGQQRGHLRVDYDVKDLLRDVIYKFYGVEKQKPNRRLSNILSHMCHLIKYDIIGHYVIM